MRYARGGPLQWSALAPDATLRLRSHHRFDLEHAVLLLAQDAPGWAAIERDQIGPLDDLDGAFANSLPAGNDRLKTTLGQLYKAGILDVGGQTGLSGKADFTCSGKAPAPPRDFLSDTPVETKPAPPNVLLVKLTGACNWACTYCYDYDKARFRNNLQLEDIAQTIAEIVGFHRGITIMFHGGEPLLQYEELKRIVAFANERCRDCGGKARFALQTNGALVSEEVIDFLNEHSFDIGISVDGPPAINDLTRVDHLGRGTAHAIESLYARYPDFMAKRVGIITTVTSKNVNHLADIATYLRDLGARSWKTVIFDTEGRGTLYPELRPPLAPYIEFLRQWLDECEGGLWNGFKFKNILELIDTIASPKRPNICLKFPCGAGHEFMVASADADLMACDATYDPLFVLGKARDGLSPAQTSANARVLAEREAWLLSEAECATCPWLHYCAGTCMAKALVRHGTVKAVDDFECGARKAAFPILFEKLINPKSGLRAYYLASRRAAPAEVQ